MKFKYYIKFNSTSLFLNTYGGSPIVFLRSNYIVCDSGDSLADNIVPLFSVWGTANDAWAVRGAICLVPAKLAQRLAASYVPSRRVYSLIRGGAVFPGHFGNASGQR